MEALVAMERTLVLIKPDALQRGIVGKIITRIERKGLKLIGARMTRLTDELIDDHYGHLLDMPFFPEIKDFMTSLPVIALCIEGLDAIETVRRLAGITLAREADPGTIRGDFAMSVQCNLIHASDSPETAEAEVPRFFKRDQIFPYDRLVDSVIYAPKEAKNG